MGEGISGRIFPESAGKHLKSLDSPHRNSHNFSDPAYRPSPNLLVLRVPPTSPPNDLQLILSPTRLQMPILRLMVFAKLFFPS